MDVLAHNKEYKVMNEMTEFEKEYYKWENKYIPLDPNKFYADIPDNVENVLKGS
jgi:hypothetical protein